MILEVFVLDYGRILENLFFEKLKEIIILIYVEEFNMRVIVFVRIWIMIECLVNWMEDIEEL